jgi:two-component system response regulator BaeR
MGTPGEQSIPHILVVEDEQKIAALLVDYLHAAGYRSSHCADGSQAMQFLQTQAVDLVLLDLMLPGIDGIELCRRLRVFSNVPVIMLTARVDEVDRLLGLEIGADDYICKPFSPREVVARVKAHLRRAGLQALPPAKGMSIERPAETPLFAVDRSCMRILLQGQALSLTPVEFRLLAELIAHPGRVYSRQQLIDFAHDDQRDTSDRTIDTHIKNIRRKIIAILPQCDCLQSVYGVGYRFELPA